LRPSSLGGVPTEMSLPASKLTLLLTEDVLPSLMNERLVKKAVDDPRMRPVSLGLARLKVSRYVLDVPLPGWMQGCTETTSPVLPLPQVLHNLLRVRARLAAMRGLVMLV